jgi:hypothetical protein
MYLTSPIPLSTLTQLPPQQRAHALTLGEDVEVEFFVWGMGIVVGQREAKEQGVEAEDFF